MRALGVYLYAGGFAAGLRQAGFEVVAHLEDDSGYGVSSARLNFPDTQFYWGPAKWPVEELKNLPTIDLIAANPPCALFSNMGIATTRGRDGWRTDPRLACWNHTFGLLEQLHPRAWVLESVTEAFTKGREVIDTFTKQALLGGYSVTFLFINSKWMGIPQARRRFFLIFHKPATLTGYSLNWAPPPTIGEVLAEVDEPGDYPTIGREDLRRALAETKPGHRLTEAWMLQNSDIEERRAAHPRGHVTGRPSFADRRVDANEVMGAFVGTKNFHPTENRFLGFNEMKAVCGYPPDFKLDGPVAGWGSLLARAVMPPVGAFLGRAVISTLSQPDAEWKQRRVTLIDVREPDREPVDLTGDYLDDNGRVRLRVRASGEIDYSARVASSPPKVLAAPKTPQVPPGADRRTRASSTVIPLNRLSLPGDLTVVGDAPVPQSGEGSGKFIQRLWLGGLHDPDRLVELVHANYAGRTTTRSDVYYNYRILLDAGQVGATWPGKRGRVQNTLTRQLSTISSTEIIVDIGAGPGTELIVSRSSPLASAPFINTGRGPKVVMTGFTRSQAFPSLKPDQVHVRVQKFIARELVNFDLDVDWSVGGLDTPRNNFDAAFICMGPLLTIPACQYAAQALWTLAQAYRRRRPVVLFYEDWKITEMHRHLSYAARDTGFDGPVLRRFVKWAHVKEADLVRRREEILEVSRLLLGDRQLDGPLRRSTALTEGEWPPEWTALIPAFAGIGDRKKVLQYIPCRQLLSIDPTPLFEEIGILNFDNNRASPFIKQQSWLMAGLADHSRWIKELDLSWPVRYFGYRKLGTKLRTETDVAVETGRHWGTLAPAYDISGSGWFRARYLMAARGGSIILSGDEDAKMLGPGYEVKPREVESSEYSRLVEIATTQSKMFLDKGKINLEHAQFTEECRRVSEALE